MIQSAQYIDHFLTFGLPTNTRWPIIFTQISTRLLLLLSDGGTGCDSAERNVAQFPIFYSYIMITSTLINTPIAFLKFLLVPGSFMIVLLNNPEGWPTRYVNFPGRLCFLKVKIKITLEF